MTPTDRPDETEGIALPMFEDALWSALRIEHTRRSRGSHRTRRVLAAAAAVAVLAGVGGVVATSAGGDDDQTTVAGPSTETTVPLSIEDRALAVLDPIARSSVVIEESYEDGVLVTRSWHDTRTWGVRTIWYDAAGRPTGEIGLLEQPGDEPPEQAVWIDHCRREWGQEPLSYFGSSSFDVVAGDLGRAMFADGREEVDGVEMIRLRSVAEGELGSMLDGEGELAVDPEQIRPDQLEQRVTFFLDPDTLLPAAVRVAGSPERLERLTVQPRTADTLSQVVTTAPSTGYEEVAPVDDGSLSMFQGAAAC